MDYILLCALIGAFLFAVFLIYCLFFGGKD